MPLKKLPYENIQRIIGAENYLHASVFAGSESARNIASYHLDRTG
jgi:hypothetical protein